MQTVIGVRFKQAGKIYYFGAGSMDIAQGDDVIVETSRGIEFGHVALGPREVEDAEVTLPLKAVERKATDEDRAQVAENRAREKEAFRICEEKIAARELDMKLVSVEYTFDVSKIIFYFTADGRIDFRELVKDLAAVFRTRIELRQIGVRDEAKMLGGIGCCGRPLCCATFLGDFVPVSIRMAKEQNLSLNPTKISGICGRLMCCLKYENDVYCERRREQSAIRKSQAPHPGGRVATMEGDGKVISINAQRRSATILLDDSRTIVASWEDIVEQEEDLSDVAALAAIAMLQSEENGEEQRPRKRGGRGREDRKERQPRGEGEGRKKGPRREGENSPKRRGERFDKGDRNGKPRKERESRGGNKHASHDRPPRREEGRGRSRKNYAETRDGDHEGRPPREE